MVADAYGSVTAGSVTLRVVVHGRGGHAGAPHLAVDPVVAAAHVVTGLQTVVAVTVGSLRAGERANVVPDRAEIVRLAASPVTHPDPGLTAAVREAHAAEFGVERVAMWPPSLATEDFALFGDAGTDVRGERGIRLGYWRVGTVGPAAWSCAPGATAAEKMAALPASHTPDFAPTPAPPCRPPSAP